ncbi:hypothetical protein FS837_012369 [Tulasnella sp. UAMH 9824]|nr:hypothetical protein FS837_012369 [Tulasnella sp. UAMH 9824]
MQDHHDEAISYYTKASNLLAEVGQSARASHALGKAAEIRKTLYEAIADSAETAEVKEDPILASNSLVLHFGYRDTVLHQIETARTYRRAPEEYII